MRRSTGIWIALLTVLLAGKPTPPAEATSDLVVPPAGYSYQAVVDCPFPGVVYQACEDQMQRLATNLAAAKAEGKLLLVVLGADWCPWCRALERLLPSDQVLARKDELFDFPARYAITNIATSAVSKGKKVPVPSGEAVVSLLMSHANAARPRSIPYLVIIDPKSGGVVHRNSADLEDPWNKDGGHDASKIREELRAAYATLRPAG